MAKKFNIHNWQAKYLFEQDNFTPDLEDDELKRSKIQQMMAKEKEPMGGDEKLRSAVEAIADMYSYGEILDAMESFYIKNDEQVYAEMAKKHAKEFRDFLDSEDELDEQNVTGTGASFTAGSGEGYMSPNAFGNNKRKKRKGYKGYKELNEQEEIDWSSASDEEIKTIGGDVYYGSEGSDNPEDGQRILVPPKGGWPSGVDLDGDGDIDIDDIDFDNYDANMPSSKPDVPKDVEYIYDIVLKRINNRQEYGPFIRTALEIDVPQKRASLNAAFSDLPSFRSQLLKHFGNEEDPTITYNVDPQPKTKTNKKTIKSASKSKSAIGKAIDSFDPVDYKSGKPDKTTSRQIDKYI